MVRFCACNPLPKPNSHTPVAVGSKAAPSVSPIACTACKANWNKLKALLKVQSCKLKVPQRKEGKHNLRRVKSVKWSENLLSSSLFLWSVLSRSVEMHRVDSDWCHFAAFGAQRATRPLVAWSSVRDGFKFGSEQNRNKCKRAETIVHLEFQSETLRPKSSN